MNDYKNINLRNTIVEFSTYNNKKIILCGTHNNRLECFFNNLNKNNNYSNKSFNNCVIIKCYKDQKVKFKMIYEGETYDGKQNNTKSLCKSTNKCWDIISFNNYFDNYSFDNYINLPNDTEIFFIRHGLGIHNKMNILQKIINTNKDSELDAIGIEQSKRVGIFLKGYFTNFYKNIIIKYVASHLIRTQQTIAEIMKGLQKIDIIYIIPCIHEISFSNNCDTSLINKIQPSSNIPNCTNNEGTCNKLNDIEINWDYYSEFYKLNKKCQDTNIINEIIKVI
jgi:bisphosphoglycerate-dependent phosphoglycerate mutase